MKFTMSRNDVLSLIMITVLSIAMTATTVIAPTFETGNTTLNASVNVFVDIIPSTQLNTGIFFDAVDPNTLGNPAQNNTNCASGTCYNVTVDSGSNVNIDFYNALSANITGLTVNESSSITSSSTVFSTNTTIIDSYSIIGNTTVNCTNVTGSGNCWSKYYLDVAASTTGGTKSTTYKYCGVQNGQASTSCT